jgi:hypothetical protein
MQRSHLYLFHTMSSNLRNYLIECHFPSYPLQHAKTTAHAKPKVTQKQSHIKNAINAVNPSTASDLGTSTPADAPPSNVIAEGNAEAEGTMKDEAIVL